MGCVSSSGEFHNNAPPNADVVSDADEEVAFFPENEDFEEIEENSLVQRIEPDAQEELEEDLSFLEEEYNVSEEEEDHFNFNPLEEEDQFNLITEVPRLGPLNSANHILGDLSDHIDINDSLGLDTPAVSELPPPLRPQLHFSEEDLLDIPNDLPNMAETPVLQRHRARRSEIPFPNSNNEDDVVFQFDINVIDDVDQDDDEDEPPEDPYVEQFFGDGLDIKELLINKNKLDNTINLLEPYICFICFDILQDPIVLIPCGHDLCRRCYTRMKRQSRELRNGEVPCGVCRTPININTPTKFFPPSIRARDYLDKPKFNVHCIFYYNNNSLDTIREGGCDQCISIHKLKEHSRSCPRRYDSCKYCQKCVPFETLQEHEQVCREHKHITFIVKPQENRRIKLMMQPEEPIYNCIEHFLEDQILSPHLGNYFLTFENEERLCTESLVKEIEEITELFLDVEAHVQVIEEI